MIANHYKPHSTQLQSIDNQYTGIIPNLILFHNLYKVLQTLFGLKEIHLNNLSPILSGSVDPQDIYDKISELHLKLKDNSQIENVPAYVVKSLLNAFAK